MFAGTVGIASGADIYIDVARELLSSSRDNITIVFIGEGLLKHEMQQDSERLGLKNIIFLPFQSEERLSAALSAADIMLLPMNKRHGISSVPSKLITYMAVGRPTFYCGPNESATLDMIVEAGCGWIVTPPEPVAIAKLLTELASDTDELQRRGNNARAFFERNFEKQSALKKFDLLFSRFVN
jgi:colanic acid biosynthesis glycosyl transferase WcaI